MALHRRLKLLLSLQLALSRYAVVLCAHHRARPRHTHYRQALLACGCSVLLTAYTNSAVDNILLKLAAANIPFIRAGHAHSAHPGVRDYTLGGCRFPDTSTAALQRIAATVPVVCPRAMPPGAITVAKQFVVLA
jgi:hypothetical protein